MINVHLNGDIVRYPNIRQIQFENRQVADSHCICRYNVKESDCEAWKCRITAYQKWNDIKPRCIFAGCDLCPKHRERIELGKQEKSYLIDNVVYRRLASSAHYMIKESKTKVLFVTLTFPRFHNSKFENYLLLTNEEKKQFEYEVNQCFSKFVENIRTNYGCDGYIGVREFGSHTNRIHFHMLCAIPFVAFNRLNHAWCYSISDLCEYSGNAVQTNTKTRLIKNPTRTIRYVCKYFSKTRGQRSGTRIVFISNNIIQKPKNMSAPLESLLDSFKFDYMKQTSDFTTCFRITDENEFTVFCNKFLYSFFELSLKKPSKLHGFP